VWLLDEVDEANVEKPRAPGGMTGGVEFEAMAYLVRHGLHNVACELIRDVRPRISGF
jgi:hypothetical protein